MSAAPKRPWDRTDPEWAAQHHRAAGAGSPVAALRHQIVAGVGELRGAGPLRLGLGSLGIVAILFGAVRILTNPAATKPVHLALWLAAVVIVHDGIIAPVTVVVGYLIARVIRGRPQAYVQAAVAMAAMIAVIALPQIYRRGKSAPGTTLLHRNYALNLVIIVGAVAVLAALAYAITGRRRASSSAPDHDDATVGTSGVSTRAAGSGATSTNERPAHNH